MPPSESPRPPWYAGAEERATLSDSTGSHARTRRSCGACSLCCTVLRVDELSKLAGTPCTKLRAGGSEGTGCAIYPSRPRICRTYRCLWLEGGLREEDRPDLLGAVLDLAPVGHSMRLEIRERERGAFDRSPRLQEIARSYRESITVRVTDLEDVTNPDRAFRVLLGAGEEQLVEGESVTRFRDGRALGRMRIGWWERQARRLQVRIREHRIRRAVERRPPTSR